MTALEGPLLELPKLPRLVGWQRWAWEELFFSPLTRRHSTCTLVIVVLHSCSSQIVLYNIQSTAVFCRLTSLHSTCTLATVNVCCTLTCLLSSVQCNLHTVQCAPLNSCSCKLYFETEAAMVNWLNCTLTHLPPYSWLFYDRIQRTRSGWYWEKCVWSAQLLCW